MSAKERTGTNGNEGIVGRIDVESPKKGFESSQSKSSCIMGSSLSSPASRHINHKKTQVCISAGQMALQCYWKLFQKHDVLMNQFFGKMNWQFTIHPQNSDFKLMLDSKIQ